MDWSHARRKLVELAAVSRAATASPPDAEDGSAGDPTGPAALPRRAVSLCIASGKGGTGKTVVTAALAHVFAGRGRTLLVDADLGVGNAHILQDASPTHSFVDVVEGRCDLAEARVACGSGADLVAAGCGVPRMSDLTKYELHLIASGLEELEPDYDYVLVDSAAGVSRQTVNFAKSCDAVLIVTTPDLTAMTDAYAFLKVLLARRPDAEPLFLVNRARDEEQASEVIERIGRVCRRFLKEAPRSIGWLPDDPAVSASVNQRSSVLAAEPCAPVAVALRRTAVRLLDDLATRRPRGLGRSLRGDVGFVRRLA